MYTRGMDTPRRCIILAPFALVAASSCANPVIQRTIHTSQCVIADDRLGKAIMAPREAVAYLRGVAAEAKAIIQAMPQKLTQGGDLTREYRLIEDLLDLVTRLEACIREGSSGITDGDRAELERRIAAIRTSTRTL